MPCLPFKKNNPRSVRGAVRRGWHAVDVSRNYVDKYNRSYVGIQIWTTRNCKGYYVSSFLPHPRFAFEREEDAVLFTLRFGL